MKRLLILCGAVVLAAAPLGCAGKGSSGRAEPPTKVEPLTQPGGVGPPGGKLRPPPPPPPLPGR
jgi:hypothetical protein